MSAIHDRTNVFIVRIWIEPREIPGSKPEWRGYIEHVSSGERRSFQDLGEVGRFIATHLARLGVHPGPAPPWQRFLHQISRRLRRAFRRDTGQDH